MNLIAYNPTAAGYAASPPGRGSRRSRPSCAGAASPTSYRRSHGSDIEAACGQLAVAGAGARRRELRRAAVR